jgi:hypothetical protein
LVVVVVVVVVETTYVQGPFEKFMASSYYSVLEPRGGVMMVSFLKYLPWQMVHFLQHSTHFMKTCFRPLMTYKFLTLELLFCGWKSPETVWHEF